MHRFATDRLKTHARFVKLLVVPSGPFCFADEVEIFKGEPEFLKTPHIGEAITNAKTFFQSIEVRMAIERRIRDDARQHPPRTPTPTMVIDRHPPPTASRISPSQM